MRLSLVSHLMVAVDPGPRGKPPDDIPFQGQEVELIPWYGGQSLVE